MAFFISAKVTQRDKGRLEKQKNRTNQGHMPRWEKWKSETIESLKNQNNKAVKGGQR